MIDAGHGGYDRGATSGAIYEKHLALDTARRLQRYLTRRGVDVTMVRSGDNFVTLDGRVAVGNRFRDALFVSIHYNSASNRDATGIETFYYTPQSGRLAGFVQYNIIKKMRLVDRGVKHRGFRVIKYSRNPSILVECGFLSNSGERRACLAPAYRQKMAESIGYGIIRFDKSR